jgi:streptogramin lyase
MKPWGATETSEWRAGLAVVLTLATLTALLAGCASTHAPSATVTATSGAGIVKNYTDPSSISDPSGITTGPDGALWFTNQNFNTIGRITTAGTINSYFDQSSSITWDITTGPDGALWFTNLGNNVIGRITADGVSTFYSRPQIVGPLDIAVGSDGALWVTNNGNNSIGRITTAGVATSFTDSTVDAPIGITVGRDKALWFTNNGNNSIGRITTAGAMTNYTDSTISSPTGITAGPDGALWFTNSGNDSIGRITTSGVMTNYTDSTISKPTGITAGPDGALWFTNSGNNSIGRITTGRPERRAIISPDRYSTVAGTGFTFTVSTAGTLVPTITESGTLPRGVAFRNYGNGTGRIAGTPPTPGVYHFTFTATFGRGPSQKVVTQAFTLTVDPATGASP